MALILTGGVLSKHRSAGSVSLSALPTALVFGRTMGAVASAMNAEADKELDDAKKKNNAVFKALETKLEVMLLEIASTRGSAEAVKRTEVAGGRTAMRVSEIRASTKAGVDQEIMDGIGDFLSMATGAEPAEAAVAGVKKTLSAGVNALLGAQDGQSKSKRSFVCLFIGNAFVRIDYYLYSYSVSAKKWGLDKGEGGFVYVADLAVLNHKDITPEESSYFISQSFDTTDPEEAKYIAEMMINIALLQRLQRTLSEEGAKMSDLLETMKQYNLVEAEINKIATVLPKYKNSTERARLAALVDARGAPALT